MIKAFFDGSCTPNPGGIIGYGAVIYEHEKIIYEISLIANVEDKLRTNNSAEYIALIAALRYLQSKNYQDKEIYVFGDSLLVINQMSGIWQMNEGKYLKYAELAQNYLKHFSNLTLEWIPKERNGYADLLSRRVV